mmetsp:Transcript_36447/g.113577  ORF Transcript_36447/g.113577 Transcript_36447/m.113577 type:complete len:323 (+) Transcript_36447:933-1901(+)
MRHPGQTEVDLALPRDDGLRNTFMMAIVGEVLVTVNHVCGWSMQFHLKALDSVAVLKTSIEREYLVPVECQRIIFGSQVVNDSRTLVTCCACGDVNGHEAKLQVTMIVVLDCLDFGGTVGDHAEQIRIIKLLASGGHLSQLNDATLDVLYSMLERPHPTEAAWMLVDGILAEKLPLGMIPVLVGMVLRTCLRDLNEYQATTLGLVLLSQKDKADRMHWMTELVKSSQCGWASDLNEQEAAELGLKLLSQRDKVDMMHLLKEIFRCDMGGRSVRVRSIKALAALAEPGDADAIDSFTVCLDDPDTDVRQAANDALTVLRPPGP